LSETLFRPATKADHAALTEIWFRAVTATHDFLTPGQIEGYRRRLPVEFLPAVPELTVAEAEGRPVGFIGMAGDEVAMLFIDPDFHGRGIGSDLVGRAAAGRGPLKVDVNEQNPAAHRFYLGLGFEQTGRSATDSDGDPFPMLHLKRPAGGPPVR